MYAASLKRFVSVAVPKKSFPDFTASSWRPWPDTEAAPPHAERRSQLVSLAMFFLFFFLFEDRPA